MRLKEHSGFGVFKAKHKTASAKVQFIKGTGQIEINGSNYATIFQSNELAMGIFLKPLITAGIITKTDPFSPQKNVEFNYENLLIAAYDIKITVFGGGTVGQATAIQRALAHAISKIDFSKKSVLKAEGQLSKKVYRKERKKYGLKKSRKAPQFSKR